ncbi:Rmr1p NDAI_0I03290 [Naumovozyma dairenensis CBS 421]|uniref:Reduced meiotic recombination protein 1 n=1 Tax=Naumovozyma dairenensis (strain ATCC 10597 / BCRC 20456 / CBS 421 / NBRC 0211 / NRRL Y-12639) TaxID=1071378 RepID=G0WGI6_NAUDC|nr:hypothetical protein NDAI_0I03290 [Naumovozyma dairenensis CBS 421]CCD26897.1 hypothetical protein NDAI_0I03290 [Naumovozyma dairenensis CBS 421]
MSTVNETSKNNNKVEVDGISVSVTDDEDEDLLEYDDNSIEEEVSEPTHNNKDNNDSSNINEARAIAETLLKKKLPKIIVYFEDDTFLLFDYDLSQDNDDLTVSDNTFPIICDNPRFFNTSCTEFMASVRRFLEKYYNGVLFNSKEILMDIPALDLTLCEDNLYNNQISFNDIETIFRILKERSIANSELRVPAYMEIRIQTRPRFVSRYNALVELTEGAATLQNIKPFSNNEDDPLILDDNELSAVNQGEKIVMDLDEDDEDGMAKNQQSNAMDEPNHADDSDNSSDELLEIMTDEEGDSEMS